MDVKRFRKIIIALLIVLSATILFQYYTTDTKADWKDASSFLLENSIRGDVFLFDKVVAPFKFHYGEGNEIVYRLPAIDKGGLEGFEAIKKKDLDNSTGIWLVLSKNYQNKDRYRELLRSEYEEDLDAEFYRIKIYHYSQKQ